MWGFQQTGAPVGEPLTVDEAKTFLNVDADFSPADDLINGLIAAARRRVERGSFRQLLTATWLLTLDSFFDLEPRSRWTLQAVPGQEDLIPQLRGVGIFSAGNVIRLPKSPLQRVNSIQYVDGGGTLQTLDPSKYKVDTTGEPGRVAPVYGTYWPISRREINAVQISFTSGYADTAATLPAEIKLVCKRLVAAWYGAQREPTADSQKLELALDSLIFQFWTGEL